MGLKSDLKRGRDLVYRALFRRAYAPRVRIEITDAFHRLYYEAEVTGGTWRSTYWLGTPVAKCPLDLWVYQEIIAETRPDVIVECGTHAGGSASYFASIFDLLGSGRVVTVELNPQPNLPEHDRITYLTGSSTAPDVFDQVTAAVRPDDRVMVVLDSDHRHEHVLRELQLYAPLVSAGCYLVVEDTNLNGNPVEPSFGPGPMEAVRDFLAADEGRFEIDREREKFFLTFNPRGFLRRISQ